MKKFIMNSKTNLFFGFLFVGIILIGGLWIWYEVFRTSQNTSFNRIIGIRETSIEEIIQNPVKFKDIAVKINGTFLTMETGELICGLTQGTQRLYDENNNFIFLVGANRTCDVIENTPQNLEIIGIVKWKTPQVLPDIIIEKCAILKGEINQSEWLTQRKDFILKKGKIKNTPVSIQYIAKRNTKQILINLITSDDLDLHLYDKNGKHTGDKNSVVEESIFNTEYSGSDKRNEWIKIQGNLASDNYIIEIVPIKTGEFSSGDYTISITEYPELPAELTVLSSSLFSHLEGSEGESENFDLYIKECGGFNDLLNVTLKATDIISEDGSKINSSNLVFHKNNFDIGTGENINCPFTLNIPKDISSGVYEGAIHIKATDSLTGLTTLCCCSYDVKIKISIK